MDDGVGPWTGEYVRQAAEAPYVGREEALILTQRVQQGDAGAKESLINANRRLVVSMARKYVVASLHEEGWETCLVAQSSDAEQLARLLPKGEEGLLKAVDRFDESKGFSFAAYATWWIRQAIIEGTQGGEPDGVQEPRSPAPASPARAASLELPGGGF